MIPRRLFDKTPDILYSYGRFGLYFGLGLDRFAATSPLGVSLV